MNKNKNKLVIAGVKIDPASLKMRMDSLKSLTTDKGNGIYGFIMNRPDVQLLTGIDLVEADQDRQVERINKLFTTGTDAGLAPEMRLPAATLLTSHRHLATALRISNSDKTVTTLPMAIGVGVIGTCVTCASSPRKNLIARYHDFRHGGGVSSDPKYDQAQDNDPFMDIGAMSLLVPVLHYVTAKDKELRPRVSCVCASCLDYAMSNTQSYMKKINLMSARVPGKVDQVRTGVRLDNNQLRPSKASGNDNNAISVKKIIAYAGQHPALSNIIKKEKKSITHKDKPKQTITKTVLAVDRAIAERYCEIHAQSAYDKSLKEALKMMSPTNESAWNKLSEARAGPESLGDDLKQFDTAFIPKDGEEE